MLGGQGKSILGHNGFAGAGVCSHKDRLALLQVENSFFLEGVQLKGEAVRHVRPQPEGQHTEGGDCRWVGNQGGERKQEKKKKKKNKRIFRGGSWKGWREVEKEECSTMCGFKLRGSMRLHLAAHGYNIEGPRGAGRGGRGRPCL